MNPAAPLYSLADVYYQHLRVNSVHPLTRFIAIYTRVFCTIRNANTPKGVNEIPKGPLANAAYLRQAAPTDHEILHLRWSKEDASG